MTPKAQLGYNWIKLRLHLGYDQVTRVLTLIYIWLHLRNSLFTFRLNLGKAGLTLYLGTITLGLHLFLKSAATDTEVTVGCTEVPLILARQSADCPGDWAYVTLTSRSHLFR